ncbi:TPA: hypothetical protein ACJHIR_002124 [Staphylococcus pseudintermedius]
MRLNNVKLSELGQGALQELFESELEKVIENINDINTDPTKKRKITMTIDIKSDEYREIIFADAKVKSNLVSMDSTGIKLFNIVDENGERVVNELRSGVKGQAFIDDDGSIKNDDVKNLLRILGNLRSSNIRNAGDNGVSQIVETKRGVTMAQEEVVPNPVRLKPFRTFTEIEQPESLFVFRLRESGNEIQAGLFEADGGAWKNVARLSIKDYLIENLKEQIENNSILIIG